MVLIRVRRMRRRRGGRRGVLRSRGVWLLRREMGIVEF
jgi:hypothetical protein